MGQPASTLQMRNDQGVQPGTYRIVSAVAGTAIQVADSDHAKVETWEHHGGDNQQWFLQRSGEGYRFKNCRHGSYLAVSSTDNFSRVYAGRYPTTWVLSKRNDSYMIKCGDNIRVCDLHYGSAANGNVIHIWPPDGNRNKAWRFERLGDDTGEELPESYRAEAARLQRELIAQTEKLTLKEQELSRCQDTIRQLQRELQLQTRQNQQRSETGGIRAQIDRVEHLMTQMMNRDSRPPGGYNMT